MRLNYQNINYLSQLLNHILRGPPIGNQNVDVRPWCHFDESRILKFTAVSQNDPLAAVQNIFPFQANIRKRSGTYSAFIQYATSSKKDNIQ